MGDICYRETGAWADTGDLDMGAGTKAPKRYWIQCPHCKKISSQSERCAGSICSNCNKYYSITKEMRMEDVDVEDLPSQSFHIPNQALLDFRHGMEQKAENWKNQQLVKRSQPGYEATHHGPVDSITGKRAK